MTGKQTARKMGRPSQYDRPRTTDEVAAMLARQGLMDAQIAAALKVSERTLYRWKQAHPEMWQSIREAGAETDSRVEESLLRRCLGFVYEDDGKKRTALPDVTAIRFWLMNRQPDRWREVKAVELAVGGVPAEVRQEIVEVLCRAIDETLTPEDGDRLMRWVDEHLSDIEERGGRCQGKRRR